MGTEMHPSTCASHPVPTYHPHSIPAARRSTRGPRNYRQARYPIPNLESLYFPDKGAQRPRELPGPSRAEKALVEEQASNGVEPNVPYPSKRDIREHERAAFVSTYAMRGDPYSPPLYYDADPLAFYQPTHVDHPGGSFVDARRGALYGPTHW